MDVDYEAGAAAPRPLTAFLGGSATATKALTGLIDDLSTASAANDATTTANANALAGGHNLQHYRHRRRHRFFLFLRLCRQLLQV